jgi:hypothetical protein
MKTEFAAAILTLSGVVLLLTLFKLFFLSTRKKLEHHIQKNFSKGEIVGATTNANSFNGKSVFSKLLCIQYKTGSELDAVAWAVKNPESWKKSIEKLAALELNRFKKKNGK